MEFARAKEHRETAWKRLEWIPGNCALDRAFDLFQAAERKSAPAEWMLAIINDTRG